MTDKDKIHMLLFNDDFKVISDEYCRLLHLNTITHAFTTCGEDWEEFPHKMPVDGKRCYLLIEIRG